jgi:GTP-binding protein
MTKITATTFKDIYFLLSVAQLKQLPPDEGIEIAFAGRSNAGKSSALNALTGIKGLARASKTPGRTQLINLFALDEQRRLVDLPGYGYAKVPEEVKIRWQQNLAKYLETRHCLVGLILLMDIRHPLKDLDYLLIDWAQQSQLPVHILLTKADKLTRGASAKVLQQVRNALSDYDTASISIQTFSALRNTGLDEARTKIAEWLKLANIQ